MARSVRNGACRLGSHEIALTIGVVVICGLVVFHSLSNPLDARQAAQEPQEAEAQRLAAEAGDADAQYSLGLSYQDGDGVRQDDVEAVRWFRLAASQGHAVAQHNLGLAYANGTGVLKDDADAVQWFRRAADQGYAVAQHNLAVGYANGMGVPQNPTEAARWYRLAAGRGYGRAADDLTALEATMTSEQIAEAKRLAGEWKPTTKP